ncbi:hypothetical protein EC988_005193, partial [Linderina pennispora]
MHLATFGRSTRRFTAVHISHRSFGIRTTLRAQEAIANIIKRDQQANQPDPPPSPSDYLVSNMPRELRIPMQPQPIRAETMSQQWSTSDLEHLD